MKSIEQLRDRIKKIKNSNRGQHEIIKEVLLDLVDHLAWNTTEEEIDTDPPMGSIPIDADESGFEKEII